MKNTSENLKEDPEKIREQTKTILSRLLAADDVVRMKYHKGDLAGEKASKLSHAIAVAVDGIVLTALRDKRFAQNVVTVLEDHVENGEGDPLPYHHILHLLAYTHGIKAHGEVHDPDELFDSYAWVRKEMDLENVKEEREKLKENLDEGAKRFRLIEVKGSEDNQMFG